MGALDAMDWLSVEAKHLIRLRSTIAWFEKQEEWRLSPRDEDHIWAFIVRRLSAWQGYNPVTELRRLGHPEGEVRALLKRAQLSEEDLVDAPLGWPSEKASIQQDFFIS